MHLDKFYDTDDTYSVNVDYIKASEDMTEFLVEEGHENILFIKEFSNAKIGLEKLKGYNEVVKKNNLKSFETSVEGVTERDGYKYGEEIWNVIEKDGITACFFSEDELAIGFLNYCYDNNKKVPEDISVVGFGDIKTASLYRPRLTTVREPYYDYGAVAVRKIIKSIKDKEDMDKVTILPSSLIVRETVKNLK